MKTKKFLLPLILLAVGLAGMLMAHAAFHIVKVPTVTEYEFPYSVTYELEGETKELKGIFRCEYDPLSYEEAADPIDRIYYGYDKQTGEEGMIVAVLAEKDGKTLEMFLELHADYLMGDPFYDTYYEDRAYEPVVMVFDQEGEGYEDEAHLAEFGIKVISWDLPEPIENTLVFSRIGRISANSILPMLLAAYATLLLCMILVRKDKTLASRKTDKVSAVLNAVIALSIVPFMAFFGALTRAYTFGRRPADQLLYCVPALSVLFVAASVCLRRRGCTKSGLLIQFAGPVLFVLSIFLGAG